MKGRNERLNFGCQPVDLTQAGLNPVHPGPNPVHPSLILSIPAPTLSIPAPIPSIPARIGAKDRFIAPANHAGSAP